jgi:hypothetical protein
MRRRFRVSFRRAGICTIWRLGFRQFSFHRIARVSRRTVPDTWTRPPVSCHALFPLTFRRQVRHQTQGPPSNPSRLRRGYDEAPRGALRTCRRQGLPGLPCRWHPRPSCMPHGPSPRTAKLTAGYGAGGEREPGGDARMPPGLEDRAPGWPAGREPGDPGRSGAGDGRQTGIIQRAEAPAGGGQELLPGRARAAGCGADTGVMQDLPDRRGSDRVPSLTSSPCTRRCPHAGLSVAIWITSLRIVAAVDARDAGGSCSPVYVRPAAGARRAASPGHREHLIPPPAGNQRG